MSFGAIKAIIDERRFNDLIGLNENAWLEAKSSPYNLETPDARYELAKDVAAFANGTGGFIIVGLQTQLDQEAQTEAITAFNPCAQANFQIHRYESVLEEFIHPAIQGLNVSWAATNPDGTEGLGIIEVPAQNPGRQYFLIANVVESGTRIKQIVVGIVRRNESSNEPFTADQLYRYTQDGKSPTAQLLTRINEKLDALLLNSRRQPEEVDPEALYAQRTAEILDELDP
jgi:predicted HTH transcriptional regulator